MDDPELLALATTARANLAGDPWTAVSQFRIAKRSLAYRCIDSNVETAFAHLLDVARFHLDALHSAGVALTTESQNEGILVALAAGALPLARELAAITPFSHDSHRFDIRLNAALRGRLGANTADRIRYTPTVCEEPLFLAFEGAATIDASSYWRATRKRRYARTAFAKFDFFSAALSQLHNGGSSP